VEKSYSDIQIAVTSVSFSKNLLLKKELLKWFPHSKFNETGRILSGTDIPIFIKNCDAVIVGTEKIENPILEDCPNLKMISKYGVGLDNIDLEACDKRNIKIGWAGGVNALSVAEMTVGFMIALTRNLYTSSLALKKGIWIKNGGRQLSSCKIGIIGLGSIGKEVVRLLSPFTCQILVNDIVDQKNYYKLNHLEHVSKEELFKKSDIITLHVPLTPDTFYLIQKETFKLMKPNAFLINTSRGKIVKEKDLKWALMNQIIAGAAIDVYEKEPPLDRKFLNLPHLFCTPHIGGNSEEAVLAMGRKAIQHLTDFFTQKLKFERK